MSDYRVTEQDQKQAEQIRRQYIPHEENKMEQLRELDRRVKFPGKMVAGGLGLVGSLIMGAGMAKIMVNDSSSVGSDLKKGLAMSIPGMILTLLSYPAYKLVTEKRKEEYADEILHLSGELTEQ